MWTATRVITLVFTVIEVLLLIRFVLKLLSANADQALVSLIYGVTDPLIAPFRGIFAQPSGTPVVEIARHGKSQSRPRMADRYAGTMPNIGFRARIQR